MLFDSGRYCKEKLDASPLLDETGVSFILIIDKVNSMIYLYIFLSIYL